MVITLPKESQKYLEAVCAGANWKMTLRAFLKDPGTKKSFDKYLRAICAGTSWKLVVREAIKEEGGERENKK